LCNDDFNVWQVPRAREKIERFSLIMERVPDAQLAERITRLIKEAEAEKAALHPAQQRK
jgi:hypothetical protein